MRGRASHNVLMEGVMFKQVLGGMALMAAFSAPVLAAECSVDIAGTDQMQFDKKAIEVSKSCKQFTVNLKHTGKLPRNVMGHNWVLTKTADMQAVEKDGIAAGLDNQYLKAGDTRVLAHTKVLGGGESDSVTFDVAKLAAGDDYTFFCSFPGHGALMKGTLKLVD
ncbi:azurin [Bordetella pertussis]|uniref:azurin n=1 Tax=Bordetella pertussis TaxID=520 RepID=UPI0010759D9E|nr:azurin [Bordetella pertussis]QBW78423.1 azurin [Bordetella pertussis]